MRILFLYRNAAALQGVVDYLIQQSTTAVLCPSKAGNCRHDENTFSWRWFFRLRREISGRQYDLVICCANAEALWRYNRFWPRNVLELLKRLFMNFGSMGTYLLFPAIRKAGIPMAAIEWEDHTLVARKNWKLMETCTLYFKTQCPINPLKAFLFQHKRNDCVFNITRQQRLVDWAFKLRPVSLGVVPAPYLNECIETDKKTDVFFVGGVHYSWVRREGKQLLHELSKEGFRIDLPDNIPHPEYLKRASRAWLMWSPEGAEWETTRHYESLLAGAVPIINYPGIRRYFPLEHGVHCFFYSPEGDHLKTVIREAMRDTDRLRRMADAGRDYVLAHHLHERIGQHILDSMADVARAKK